MARNYNRGQRRTDFNQRRNSYVWRPKAILEWEKQFILEVGKFTWEDFIKAKKYINVPENDNVLNWNDSAAYEAFLKAKTRFKARIDGHPFPDEDDGHIEEIDPTVVTTSLSEQELEALYLEIDEIRRNRYKAREDDDMLPVWTKIRLEDIIPTGWDDNTSEDNRRLNGDLTGMIVGE